MGDALSFRSKVFLSITVTVVIAVWGVSLAVSSTITDSFERRDAQRTAELVAQFRREFDRRGAEVARRIEAIANSEAIARLALTLNGPTPDTAQCVDLAARLAQEQSLDILDLVGPDGAIISSAEWPVHFGYKESWLTQPVDWNSQGPFLRRVELGNGSELGLIAVRTVKAGDGSLYVAGGQRLDKNFIDSLPLPQGLQVRLHSDFNSRPPPEIAKSRLAMELIDEVRRNPRELSRTSGRETVTALPLFGRDHELLAILLVTNSRAELAAIKNYIRNTAFEIGGAGVVLGLALSFWTASRVTRPLRELAYSVRKVAAGEWSARATIESRDEVGQLAADFNRMTGQLVEQRDRMIQAERVAAWRELARRLAHELKNPLFPLQLTVENLQRARASPHGQFDEVFRESTTTLLAELDNLKAIIGRFSDFAKMPAPAIESVDVNQIVREVMRLFEAQINAPNRPAVESWLDLADGLPPVPADREQLQRALRNLVLNALDAMPDGGALTLRTRALDGKVAIEVSDTGAGLTPEECERLFTPYYTTKHQGTGLGLAIVQSVVSDHKGTITVRSVPGQGATFRIELKT